jgi:hypothetical protein
VARKPQQFVVVHARERISRRGGPALQRTAARRLAYRFGMKALLSRWMLLACTVLAACAGPGVTPLDQGATEAEVVQRWGEPTARYPMPGGVRLEYATGPYGVTTWMVDLDAGGRVTGWQQVLTDRHLTSVMKRLPGMSVDELLRTLGRPGERRHGGRPGGEVWGWRFENSFCLWFTVWVGPDGVVREGSFDIDPRCDRRPL